MHNNSTGELRTPMMRPLKAIRPAWSVSNGYRLTTNSSSTPDWWHSAWAASAPPSHRRARSTASATSRTSTPPNNRCINLINANQQERKLRLTALEARDRLLVRHVREQVHHALERRLWELPQLVYLLSMTVSWPPAWMKLHHRHPHLRRRLHGGVWTDIGAHHPAPPDGHGRVKLASADPTN